MEIRRRRRGKQQQQSWQLHYKRGQGPGFLRQVAPNEGREMGEREKIIYYRHSSRRVEENKKMNWKQRSNCFFFIPRRALVILQFSTAHSSSYRENALILAPFQKERERDFLGRFLEQLKPLSLNIPLSASLLLPVISLSLSGGY